MKRIHVLPNAITLANAFCGLLALAKAIDALTLIEAGHVIFYAKMESACFFVFLGMVFDSLDGLIARLTRGYSDFGAQLDSFADALTFGVVPAMLAKVLIQHEGAVPGAIPTDAELVFLASASFSLMAILRLVRFNLETDHERESHATFRGLPSPAAAGAVTSTIWLYVILLNPELEVSSGTPTPVHRLLGWMRTVDWHPVLSWVPPLLACALPLLGLLMVSRMRYIHPIVYLTSGRTQFFNLVGGVFAVFLFYLAPVPALFLVFNGFALLGLLTPLIGRLRGRTADAAVHDGAGS